MSNVIRSVHLVHRTNSYNSRSTHLTRTALSTVIVGVLYLLAGNTAFAVCSNNTPLTGDTVVCISGVPNPDTIGVQGAGADNVSVDVQASAAVAAASGASIDLRSGANITVAGEVSNAATDAIRFATPPGPGSAINSDIVAITSAVTVAKAVSADRAMNAITAIIIDGAPVSQPAPALLLGGLLSSAAMNEVTVDGGAISSNGASGSAIVSGSASATRVVVQGNGTLESNGSGGVIFQGSGSAGELILANGGTIRTAANDATGFGGGGANSAMGVQIISGGHITTTGDNATAVNLGEATYSVASFEAQGRPTDSPVIHTSGDRSRGIAFGGNSNSTLTVAISDAPTNTSSPGYLTEGDDSALIQASTPGGSSSFSVTAERAGFETRGDGSSVIDLVAGSVSDILVFLQDVTLRSQGSDSRLLTTQSGVDSLTNVVGIDINLRSAGDGASAVSIVTSGGSSMTTFLSGADVGTSGNDAVAVMLGNATGNSASSVQTVTVQDSTLSTTGTNSGALIIGGLGSSSAGETLIDELTATTLGDASVGIAIGSLGSKSAESVTMSNIEVSTTGANSAGVDIDGVSGTESVMSIDTRAAMITTLGDESQGWRVRSLPGSGSVTVINYDELVVVTNGGRSAAVVLGDQDGDVGSGGTITESSRTIVGDNTSIATQGSYSPGLTINGFGAGVANSDIQLLLENHSITTKGDNSAGAVIDTVLRNATGSLATTVIDTLTIVTQGAASTGLVIGDRTSNNAGSLGVSGQLAIANIDVTTSGDNAAGVVLDPFDANSDTSVYTFVGTDVKVRTSGVDADGMILGAGLGRSIAGTPVNGFGTELEAELATKTQELRDRGLIGPGPITVASDVRISGLDIATSGSSSDALVTGAGANIIVDNSTLATSGDGAHGAVLLSDPTVAEANALAYAGTITTTGAGSHGISGEGGAFDITLKTSGEIETTGKGSNGISVGHTGPEASKIRVDGTIDAANDGIALAAMAGAEPVLEVLNTGSVIGEVGIAVDAADQGSQRIIISGAITGRSGIAVSLAGGADTLEIFPGGVIGGLADFGAGADELWLSGLMAPLVGAGPGIGPDIFGTTAIEFAEALLNGTAFFDGGADDDTLVFDSLLNLADIGSLLEMPNAGLDAFTLAFSNADDSASVLAFRNFEFFRFGDGQIRTIASLLDDPGPSPVSAPAPLVLLFTGLLGLFARRRVLAT
tara:strand:- start:23403 stop:27023 length:3621 start_codon:yes stop_codon:yes gene_type:complete